MNRKISLVLPVISAAIISIFFLRPEITGFVVGQGGVVSADVKITTAEGVILPKGSIISVSLGERYSSMPMTILIEQSGEPFKLVEGEVHEIGYTGPGYTGNHTYKVPISRFNISREIGRGTHTIKVQVIYNGTVLSEDEEEVIV